MYQLEALWHSYCLVWDDLLADVGVVRLWFRLLQTLISYVPGLCPSALNCEVLHASFFQVVYVGHLRIIL